MISTLLHLLVPNETGGVLLGILDHAARRIHVTGFISAPADSSGTDIGFERGIQGLVPAIKEAGDRVLGQVQYVGEWHSHPKGSSTKPSSTDIEQIAWLAVNLHAEGCPAVVAIIGDHDINIVGGRANLSISFRAIAVEIRKLMLERRERAQYYKSTDTITPETNLDVYKDAMRSLIVMTHKLLAADLQTISVLGGPVAEATIALYSLTNRYDRYIDECLAYSEIPERYLEYYDGLSECAINCVSGADSLIKAIDAWQTENPVPPISEAGLSA